MGNSLELHKKKSTDGDLFFITCVFPTCFIFLQRPALWCCPASKMTAPSVLVTQFLNAFVLRALRNAFWKWGEDKWEESANSLDLWFKICVSYQMLRKMLQGGSPTLN